MYAQKYDRLNDGKTIKVTPFAMISESKDGKARKTVTSDMAVIDLSQPFGFVKVGSEPSRVTHALLSGNVLIRDDKGTIADPEDDLRVSFDPERCRRVRREDAPDHDRLSQSSSRTAT